MSSLFFFFFYSHLVEPYLYIIPYVHCLNLLTIISSFLASLLIFFSSHSSIDFFLHVRHLVAYVMTFFSPNNNSKIGALAEQYKNILFSHRRKQHNSDHFVFLGNTYKSSSFFSLFFLVVPSRCLSYYHNIITASVFICHRRHLYKYANV